MKCSFFSYKLVVILLLVFGFAEAQFINVDTSLSDVALVNKFFGTQTCITVSNISFNGSTNGGSNPSYGYFSKNGSTFDIDEGIILSTGIAKASEGPNTYRQDNGSSSWLGDPDLANAFGNSVGSYKNATYLEFDFVSNESNVISFQYMFLSEEYDKFKSISGCQYSDAFAFLIKPTATSDPYTNIALVPNTTDPVSVTNVRGSGGTCPPKNENYFGTFNIESNTSTSPTNFNGQTKVLTAIANVQVGISYHIKLVIADEGTTGHDSAVFLKSGSFVGNINIGNDLTVDNADPICENVPYRIQPNPPLGDPLAQYSWFKNGVAITTVPSTQPYYDVLNDEGDFSVKVTLGSGCQLEGNVKIEKAPVANIDSTPIQVCDNNFDGKYSAVLSDFNSQIVTNFSRDFNVSYYTTSGTLIDPDKEFVFTGSPQTINVSVGAFSCSPKIYPVQFYYGTKLGVNTTPTYLICDDDLSGSNDINLADYVALITNEAGVTPTYFDTQPKVEIGGNSTISNLQTISADKSFFIRIEKSGSCPNYKEVKFNFRQPKKSTVLKDTLICKGALVDLDAGLGFTSYKWYKASDPATILSIGHDVQNLSAGDYIVELGFNSCVYPQSVKVSEATDPVINNVLIEGTTVTVLVSGGKSPYQYALDNGSYQPSNVFNNVELGTHIVYVKGDDGCSIINQTFIIINTQNVITPNNDGINDYIDYSSLLTKLEPKFEVHDRNGTLVFRGDANNHFIWDGRLNGRVLPTSSYWYILEWNEIGVSNRTQLSGWILLKNRN
ncbi:MAG: hypothetical protein DI529_02210 [Chryseobacterium sp.]|nr:MAG: hypothetical protein DI529_02210 [Chryseobacterium sp.]